MSWLITGGCGFVGSNLADALLAQGDEVIILDNLSRVGSRENLKWLRSRYGDDWRFCEIDIRDSDRVAGLIQETQPFSIAHLAGQVAMTTSLKNPRLDFETNALGSLNVLEAVRLHSPNTIVLYSSTNKVYGDLDWVHYEEEEMRYIAPDYPDGFDETLPLSFHSPYGCSKGSADQYMLDYARMYDLQTVVFRHSSMYGGRQFSTYDQGWVGWFCQKAIETKKAQEKGLSAPVFTISGNGKQVRDVLHAEDIVQIYFSAAANIEKSSGQVFNIGGGIENSLSLLELFALLEKTLSVSLTYKNILWRQSDQKIFVANISKAKFLIHWTPQVTINNGIKHLLEWLRSNKELSI